ncbi:MAG: FtsK/SpoIIIE domain-containing protein [Collinsella sp.]
MWNIAQSPHVIVSGSTGSGKSYFTNYLIAMSAIKGCYLILADPKRSDLSAMADFFARTPRLHDPSGILN